MMISQNQRQWNPQQFRQQSQQQQRLNPTQLRTNSNDPSTALMKTTLGFQFTMNVRDPNTTAKMELRTKMKDNANHDENGKSSNRRRNRTNPPQSTMMISTTNHRPATTSRKENNSNPPAVSSRVNTTKTTAVSYTIE